MAVLVAVLDYQLGIQRFINQLYLDSHPAPFSKIPGNLGSTDGT
jgi:hypothetical protein